MYAILSFCLICFNSSMTLLSLVLDLHLLLAPPLLPNIRKPVNVNTVAKRNGSIILYCPSNPQVTTLIRSFYVC